MFSLYRLLRIIVSITILSLALPNLVTREGFSYKKCINRGFSSDFCLTTPIAGATTNVCLCKDGSEGVTMYGTGARCMCGKGSMAATASPFACQVYDVGRTATLSRSWASPNLG